MNHPQPQHLQALAKANEKRCAMAAIKRDLRATKNREIGCAVAADLIDQGRADDMRVGDLLNAIPYVGKAAILRMSRKAGIVTLDRRIRDLSDRQRRVLASLLRHRDLVFPRTRAA